MLPGEFDIIDLFREPGPPRQPWVELGSGDDCALLRPSAGSLLVTKDLLLEGIHFRRDRISAWQLGWKALAVNLSDIAAMGGQPLGVWLGLGLPTDLPLTFVRELRDGLLAGVRRFELDLLGGDTVASGSGIVLSLTVMGQVAEGRALRRSGAQPGDLLAVGGWLGESGAGLHLLLHQADTAPDLPPAAREQLVRAHLEPQPQLALGQWLSARGLATSAIDVSDGFLQDLGHLCEIDQLGAEILEAQLPLSPALLQCARSCAQDPLAWALGGGEDYVLLFTLPAARRDELAEFPQDLARGAGFPRVVGAITAEPGLRVGRAGVWRSVAPVGYDHFRR